jgi:hypothetical protein
MVYFQTQNPNLGKFWRGFERKRLVYSVSIWNIIRLFGTFYGHRVIWWQFGIFSPVLVYCVKKKLATLFETRERISISFLATTSGRQHRIQGPMLWFLKYSLFLQKNESSHWFLRKVPIFHRKLTNIAENCEHNIGPGFRQFFFPDDKTNISDNFFLMTKAEPASHKALFFCRGRRSWLQRSAGTQHGNLRARTSMFPLILNFLGENLSKISADHRPRQGNLLQIFQGP